MINQIAFLAQTALDNPTATFQVRYFLVDIIAGKNKWGEWEDIEVSYEYKDSNSKEEHYMIVLASIVLACHKKPRSYEYRLKPENNDD